MPPKLDEIQDGDGWWRRIIRDWLKKAAKENTPLMVYAKMRAQDQWVRLPDLPTDPEMWT